MSKSSSDEFGEKLSEDLDDAIEDVEHIIDQLNEYLDWVETAESQWEERPEPQKEAFESNVSEFKTRLETSERDWKFLMSFIHDIRKAYRDPLIEALRNDIKEISNELKFQATPLDLEGANWQTNYNYPLSDIHKEYLNILNDLKAAEQPVISTLSDEVERNKGLLLRPNDLSDAIDGYTNRYNKLIKISEHLGQKGFSPKDPERLVITPTQLETESVDVDQINRIIDRLDEIINTFAEYNISLNKAANNYMESEIEEGEGDEFKDSISELVGELTDLQKYEPELDSARRLRDEYQEMVENTGWKSIFDSIISTEYQSLEEFKQDIELFSDEFNQWISNQEQRWEQIRKVGHYYLSGFEFADISAPSELAIRFEEGADQDFNVAQDIPLIREGEKWLSEQEDALKDEISEESITLLQSLVKNREVKAEKFSAEAIEQVSSHIDLLLRIDET